MIKCDLCNNEAWKVCKLDHKHYVMCLVSGEWLEDLCPRCWDNAKTELIEPVNVSTN